jgi:hypothetical protein
MDGKSPKKAMPVGKPKPLPKRGQRTATNKMAMAKKK